MAPDVLNNRYHILATVAGGGMEVVYKAQDRLLNRIVAVKVLRPEYAQDPAFLESFYQEAQAAANLTHPNIVTIYDVGQDNGRPYIVMEYVEGRDLKSMIQEEAPFSIQRALSSTIDVCAGVGYAHRAGIVHCDIKPQNVLISPDGQVKVTDFGIARAFSEIVPHEVEEVWGTPHYFAPEQAAGESPTPATDVYSIGVMSFEMLTGRLPFEAEDNITLAHMHMHDEPPPLHVLNPQVSIQLAQIVNKVLSKEPAARYRTADQLGRILAGYLRGAEQATSYQPVAAAPAPSLSASERTAPARQHTPPPYEREPTPPPSKRPRQTEPPPGTDWQLWFVGAVAVLAVLGLIPLWALVYRTYTDLGQVTPTPAVTPVITTVANTTVVPRLVGLSFETAQQEAARANLGIVTEEREDPEHPVPTVLDQEPSPGQVVPSTSQVRLVVSKPLASSNVPDIVGYVISTELTEGLQSRGWSVVAEEAWSSEPEGQILSIEPQPGTSLAAGSPVTLTLSAGTSRPIPMEVNLNNTIMLDSVVLPDDRYRPGEIISVVLRWRALQPVSNSYTVFVHLIGPSGMTVAQEDREPRMGERSMPTSSWTPGVIVTDSHLVSVPPDAVSGTYQLRAGMYLPSTAQRLPVLDAGQTTAADNSILIREIQIAR